MTIRLSTIDHPEHLRVRPHCDGCGRELAYGERVLTGIRSCDGRSPECDRVLCRECVETAYSLVRQEAEL